MQPIIEINPKEGTQIKSLMKKKSSNSEEGKMNGIEKLTVREAAQAVNRSPDTIYRWIGEGFLQHYFRVRDGYLIPRTEINRILVEIRPFRIKNR